MRDASSSARPILEQENRWFYPAALGNAVNPIQRLKGRARDKELDARGAAID
jgi:hypothetical protein